MKLHLCCGDIYLRGYQNLDVDGTIMMDGLYPQKRSLENYYFDRQVGHKHQPIIDRRIDITQFQWPFDGESIEEVVMIQAVEHFEQPMAQKIVDEILRILVPGGKFLVDFPDVEGAVKKYAKTDPDFLMRFIYCNHKNQWSIHHWGYTRETFPRLLGFGWEYKFREIVHHIYPVIGVEATKLK